MRDVVADTGNLMDESFNLAQHLVHADSELVERIITPERGEALAQIACHDTLDSPVDFQESIVISRSQHHCGSNRQPERQQQAKREGPPNDFRYLGDLIDVSADHKNFAVCKRMRREPHLLILTVAAFEPNDRGYGRDV